MSEEFNDPLPSRVLIPMSMWRTSLLIAMQSFLFGFATID